MNTQLDFGNALQGLERGDFSRLEPLFVSDPAAGRSSQIVQWHEQGLFHDRAELLAEALTCACFLGWIDTAEHLLRSGVPPQGGALTGLNALHWAANRGEVQAVRLLLHWNVPLDLLNRYGGNALDAALWSLVHEPRPGQSEAIEALLAAGARPTSPAEAGAILRQHGLR